MRSTRTHPNLYSTVRLLAILTVLGATTLAMPSESSPPGGSSDVAMDSPRGAMAEPRTRDAGRGPLDLAPAPDEGTVPQLPTATPPPRHVLIPQDVPSAEMRMGEHTPRKPAYDSGMVVYGNADGEALALAFEDHQIQALYSGDGGVTWDSEVVVAGGHGVYGVSAFDVSFDGLRTIYVATDFADPNGSCGLRFQRSLDMGQTWSAPVELVQHGDDTHGINSIHIESNQSGRVAVAYADWWSGNPYARVSSDGGITWTPRVRLDPGIAENTKWIADLGVNVDAAGNVHVVFTQDRTSPWTTGSNNSLYYTRSTDGGLTFEAERDLLATGYLTLNARMPDIAITSNDNVLIAFWDNYGSDLLYVLRSKNAGMTFTTSLQRTLSATSVARRPYLFPANDSATVLVLLRQSTGSLSLNRSADYGTSFGAAITLATQANDLNEFAIARTPAGNWLVAWEDRLDDNYVSLLTDVYARASTDDGVTWSAQQRVDSTPAASATSDGVRVAAVGNDDAVVGYVDCRLLDGADCDVYVNRSPVALPAFGTDQRIDSDRETRSALHYGGSKIRSDGVDHVYAAIPAIVDGPYKDIYVAVSSDRGYTFAPAVRASSVAPGEFIVGTPQIAATPDGQVYLAYKQRLPGNSRRIRVSRSSDFGATWSSPDLDLGLGVAGSSFGLHPQLGVEALPGGTVFVWWNDPTSVQFARSVDGGANFTQTQLDDNSTSFDQPSLCIGGGRIVAAFKSTDRIWARTSADGGVTWDGMLDLRGGATGTAHQPVATCGPGGTAVVVWTDTRNGFYEIHGSQFNGSMWFSSFRIGDPMSFNGQYYPDVQFVSPMDVVAVYHQYESSSINDDLSVYAVRSLDGGANFGPPQRLDTGLRNQAASVWPRLVGDGAGNAWISWEEYSPFNPALVVRHSSDGGQTFDAVHRLDREDPQGFYWNYRDSDLLGGYSAASSGEAYFIWGGQREMNWRESIVNVYDLDDFDRDQSVTGTDCDDLDPTAVALPLVTQNVSLEKMPGGTRIAWDAQDVGAGSGTLYDVVSGEIGDLPTVALTTAACEASALSDPWVDVTDPPIGVGYYYLVRAYNGCGVGSYGDSLTVPDPRDALDLASPCD